MIITTLSITNFGVFDGEHRFDLRPRKQEKGTNPVILIGGNNGSGKTTILEAVRLCLYGRLALGSRVRKVDYETHIKQRLHRGQGSGLPARSAKVGLIFEHVHVGVKSVYDAVRSWTLDGTQIKESVSIYKDGSVMRDIAPDYWDDFLRDLIPPGLADLFFFDGEQIQSLADPETEALALETAVGGLLNLDIVQRLQSDLYTYVRQRDDPQRSLLSQEHEELSQQYEELYIAYKYLFQDSASLQTSLDRASSKMEAARQALIAEGAQFIEQRTTLETRLKQVVKDVRDTREQIRVLATKLLPFAFTPKWSQKLKIRLEKEVAIREQRFLSPYQDAVKQLLQQEIADTLSKRKWQSLEKKLDDLLDSGVTEGDIIHHFSEQQRYQLLQQIEEAVSDVPLILDDLSRQLARLEKERANIQEKLKQVPDDKIGLPLVLEFQERVERYGRLTQKVEQSQDDLKKYRYRLDELERQRSRVWHKIAEIGDKDEQVEQAAKIQVILGKYRERITKLKIKQLEQLVAEFFNLLCRKEILVKEVKIDPNDYRVTLYGENRTEIYKSELSAGERQLYAMSLLWALRSASGRSLPIIVDTPMGRLDSEHRLKLLEHFFPWAAHQIILLSTDTEIDGNAFDVLQPAISHVYRLEFDSALGRSDVKDRYFDLPLFKQHEFAL